MRCIWRGVVVGEAAVRSNLLADNGLRVRAPISTGVHILRLT